MVVTNACDPDPRVERSADWLATAGHEVTIHAFDRQQVAEVITERRGVKIIRHHLKKTPYGGLVQTALGIRRFTSVVTNHLNNKKPDLVICHDADTLKVGGELKRRHSIPFVFDMHDLQHTWVRIPAPNSYLRRKISEKMLRKMLKRLPQADVIITSSGGIQGGNFPGFRQWLESHGFESEVVENRPMHSIPLPLPKSESWTVAHLGRLRDTDSVQLLLDAVLTMPNDERPRLLIAGEGPASNVISTMLKNAEYGGEISFNIRGAFDQDSISDLLCETNVMFAMYNPNRGNINDGAIPVKMFDAAARGIPSIVNAGCLMGEICESENLGMQVKWNDVQGLADGLQRLRNSRVELLITGERERRKYLEALEGLLSSTGG